MVLSRLGNKQKIASKIIKHFPAHTSYIELFFGAGGMFFNKPLAKYNYCNDFDNNVYNLWHVFQFRNDELYDAVENLPIHITLWSEFRKYIADDKILQAALFLLYSNFGFLGKPETLRYDLGNTKRNLLNNIKSKKLHEKLSNVIFTCCDFREAMNKHGITNPDTAFVYADPPYLNTTDNYSNSFKVEDTQDLFQVLIDSKMKFAISEFNNPIVVDIAKTHNLNVIEIGERKTLGNRNTEILITNYNTVYTYEW